MSCEMAINPNEAKRLAKKLKYEDPEQFQTLVRMHLSFVLDLNMEDADNNVEKSKTKVLKWGFSSFTKKTRYPDRVPETSPLTKDILSQIYQLAHFLMKVENIEQEGIFRRSGKVTRQQELKSLLAQGVQVNLDDGQFSVHDCASVLKSFLAELPEPLLTEAYYPAYCQIAELCQAENVSNERMLHALQLVLLLLPIENRRIIKEILRLLNKTVAHVSSNRMSAENLATLFTPHLLCPRKLSPEAFHINAQNLSCVVVFMIKEGLEVFEVPPALAMDIKAYWDRRRLTPNHFLEESVSEAKTVFSFVDRTRSGADATEKALAQLYAHVQALPESSKKRRLVSKFNKENGHGTPRTKTIGDSIKKHIFHKKGKSFNDTAQFKLLGSASSGDELNSPEYNTPLTSKERTNYEGEGMPLLKPSAEPRRRRIEDNGSCDEGEESPPKMARVTPSEEEGSHGYSSEQETGGCTLRFKSLSLGHNSMDNRRVLVQRQQTPGKLGRSRVWREHRIDLQPDRSELLEQARGFRPVVIRRSRTRIRRPAIPNDWPN